MKHGRFGDGPGGRSTIRRSDLSGAPAAKKRRRKAAQAMTRDQYYARDGRKPPG